MKAPVKKRARPHVLMDVDGVLADFVGAYVEVIREVSNDETVKLPPDRDWHIWDDLSGHFGPKKLEEVRARVHAYVRDASGFCRDLKIFPGAKAAVFALALAADVTFVTSPFRGSKTWAHERTEWLEEHFGRLFGSQPLGVIHTSLKHHVDGDFLVDDKLSNIEEWVEHRDGFGLLWRKPYASCIGLASRVVSVREWDHVSEIVSTWRPTP